MRPVLIAICVLWVAAASVDAAEELNTDWATEVLGHGWDMTRPSDTGFDQGLESKGFENGVFTFRVRGSGEFHLNLAGRYVNARAYHLLSVRARCESEASLQVRWWSPLSPDFPEPVAGIIPGPRLEAGWQTYDVDLAAASTREGTPQRLWGGPSGIVSHIVMRFSAPRGAEIAVDWVRLRRDAASSSQAAAGLPNQDYRHYADPLPDLDLGFVRSPEYYFAIVADTHLSSSDSPRDRRQEELVRHLNCVKPAFVVHLGDIVTTSPWSNQFATQVKRAKSLFGRLEMPINYVPGNHDIGNKVSFVLNQKPGFGNKGVTDETIADFEEKYGTPTRYAFGHGPDRFVVIDSMGLGSETRNGPAQMAWLEEELAARNSYRHMFLMAHVHLFYTDADEPDDVHYDSVAEPSRHALLELCRRRSVTAYFAGHTHLQFYNRVGETPLIALPSTSFPRWPRWHLSGEPDYKNAYAVVRVYPEHFASNLIRIPEPVLLPLPLQLNNQNPARLVVTQFSHEHKFPCAGINADLVTEDLVAWSPSNLNDELTRYPGLRGADGAAGAVWSSEPLTGPDEKVVVEIDLGCLRKIRSVALAASAEGSFPRAFTVEASADGRKFTMVAQADDAPEPAESEPCAYRFGAIDARHVRITITGLRPDFEERNRFSAALAEIVIRDEQGVNVASKYQGARARASSNRTIRSSNVYNSNPILSDERAWHLLSDLGVNLVRLDAQSLASRILMREGKVVLHPPARELLREGTDKGIRYVVVVRPDVKLPPAVSFDDYLAFVAKEFSKPGFLVEISAEESEPARKLMAKFSSLAGDQRFLLGGFKAADVAAIEPDGLPLEKIEGLVVAVETAAEPAVSNLIEKAGALRRALCQKAGRDIQLLLDMQAAPATFRESAACLARQTFLARSEGLLPVWWHATKGKSPFFSFLRSEEPTLPYYALRLLATVLSTDGREAPGQFGTGPAPKGLRPFGLFGDKTRTVILVDPADEPADSDAFTIRTHAVLRSAKGIDLMAGTSQELAYVQEGSRATLAGLLFPKRPVAIVLDHERQDTYVSERVIP